MGILNSRPIRLPLPTFNLIYWRIAHKSSPQTRDRRESLPPTRTFPLIANPALSPTSFPPAQTSTMTDSDEDIPLGQRNQAFLFGKAKPIVISSDDDSPLPSWLDAPKTDAAGTGAAPTDSDSDIKEVISPPKLLSPSKTAATAATATQTTTATQGDGAGPSKPPATQKTAASASVEIKEEEKGAPASAGKKGATPKKKGATPKKAAAGAAAVPSGRSGLAVSSSSMAVMLPERLTQAKVLLELETGGDAPHGATDLSGDSGAIGRVLVTGPPGARQLQIDLKGKHSFLN